MKKTTRAEKAQETLAIIDRGFYQVNGEKIDVKDDITYSVSNSLLYRQVFCIIPAEWREVQSMF
ncbi:hypothetical protein SAMN04488505_10633 [Chitinophaga rupis]|uniref:Uncharacterized protein n=1 Tax=Chitinophaga rupis TaxID=573321 RepID=A0A1H8AV58_9BACT|nr:hypothetical protein [Chitinophaga rupis]SEM74701.1 hypothetical protein SAMN04488505_10633 [Chitinophaga rupis]